MSDFLEKERKVKDFTEWRFVIEPTNKNIAKMSSEFETFVEELHFLLDSSVSEIVVHEEEYSIDLYDKIANQVIGSIYFGMTKTGHFGICIDWIGLDVPEIYECWTVYHEDLMDVRDVAAEVAYVGNCDEN